jgi:hypothetical protein
MAHNNKPSSGMGFLSFIAMLALMWMVLVAIGLFDNPL